MLSNTNTKPVESPNVSTAAPSAQPAKAPIPSEPGAPDTRKMLHDWLDTLPKVNLADAVPRLFQRKDETPSP